MQNKVFWNISSNSQKDDNTYIENILKYGDFKDIKEIFTEFDKEKIKEVWLKNMAFDKRFLKINLMIARIFFDMNVEADYFKRGNNARFKVKLSVREN